MKCKECYCAEKGFFESKPYDYVCIGVKEPFVITDIEAECPIYEERRKMKLPEKDVLVVSFDYGNEDLAVIQVGKRIDDELVPIRTLWGQDAFDIYNKLANGR